MSAEPQAAVSSQPPRPETLDLFLCHTGVDKPVAREIGEQIEASAYGGRQLRVFLDEWDIGLGENIVVRLNDALSKARYVAVLMSPEMMASEWCQAEMSSILAADPTNRRGRLIPILLRDHHLERDERLEIPPFIRALNRLDFRNPKLQRQGLERLISLLCGSPAAPRSRRSRPVPAPPEATLAPPLPERVELPDEMAENLISNLLLVSELPSTIWTARTRVRRLKDLPNGVHFPPMILREGRIVTFHDPVAGPLCQIVTGSAECVAVREWRAQPDRWRWVIELLNRTLAQYLYAKGVRFDVEHRRFYFAANGPQKVTLRWGIGKSQRCVVRPPDPGEAGYWVHHAAKISFESFGNDLYLAIDPTWVFTKDGRVPVHRDNVPSLAAQWGGKERNRAILGNILLWADVITHGRDRRRIPCGDQHLRVERIPRTVEMPVGLRADQIAMRVLLAFTKADEISTAPDYFGFVNERSDDEHDKEP